MTATATTWTPRLDPVDFEILRHRLWAINDEAATTIKLVSGSPVATEASDMNTALMTAEGEVFVVGAYSLAKATTMAAVTADVLENYSESPGIADGDAFVCNDPYVGAQHQNDTALVMPVFIDGELVAWCGAELHLVDVGGPTAGQVQIGARDIWGEAPLTTPVKIVEGDRIRRDIEREYLSRSRLPDLVGLDLRAKLAATTVARRRLQELAEEYGVDVLKDALADMLDYAEARFRQRLLELPDGVWSHRTYMEYEGEIYTVVLRMRKRADELVLDLRGTSKQAPAVVNATRDALAAIARGNLCMLLCWDIPWCPSAIGRAVEVVTEPGTLVDAEWPAGVSKATTTILWVLGKSMTVVVGKMLLSSEVYADRAMAAWQGALLVEEVFGDRPDGSRFGGTLLDGMAGGGGARIGADGIDSGGYIGSMRIGIANVESYEMKYPILYLFRREQPDSGGAGAFRGGNGISLAYVPHGVDRIGTKIVHGIGVEQPMSTGLSGGYPSTTNVAVLKRGTDVRGHFERGRIPQGLDELSGELEVLPAIVSTHQDPDDVYLSILTGGGGFGDPLERDPERVARDVRVGAVTRAFAAGFYGVVLSEGEEPAPDEEATRSARGSIRASRGGEGGGDHR